MIIPASASGRRLEGETVAIADHQISAPQEMSSPARSRWIIGLGANVGSLPDMRLRLGRAVGALATLSTGGDGAGTVLSASSLYRTPPWGLENQAWFLNGAIHLETAAVVDPVTVLEWCKAAETRVGRVARERWGPREADLDLLLMQRADVSGSTSAEWISPEIRVPHRDLWRRLFALVPARELGWGPMPATGQSPAWWEGVDEPGATFAGDWTVDRAVEELVAAGQALPEVDCGPGEWWKG